MTELKPGDRIVRHYGPYVTAATVLRVTDIGAVLQPEEEPILVGFPELCYAPDGSPLTENRAEDFLGRAHWDDVRFVPPVPAPAHDCGMCGGPLRFDGMDGDIPGWKCDRCGWLHTSKDCCQ